MANTESIFSYATQIGAGLGSLYRDNRFDRSNLLEFMDLNNWFGAKYIMRDKEPRMSASALRGIRGSLALWLSAYRKTGREKLAILLERFQDQYPQTCSLYRKFVSDNQMAGDPSTWKLLDFLFCEIDREITEYSEADLERLVALMDNSATRTAAKVFADFLGTTTPDGEPLSRWTYTFNARDSPDLVNAAYPVPDFATMAYCAFNEEMWERQDMVTKAVQNKAYADLWLFVALHFICALRVSDMARLPAPALPRSGDAMMESIAAGTFTKHEAEALADELAIRLKLKPMKPSKTSAHKSVPEVKLFVPQSLRSPLGMIIAIVLAHHPEIRAGDGFVKPDTNLANIRKFFGDHFVKALGNRRLSSRRCNKSYLQGIAAIADDAPGKPKGYMLAALARSHKTGIGNLAEMTDVYLRDARFTGYSPEFIIHQMFERGIFSFIPAVLLEMYAGTAYTQLPISEQTGMIRGIGLNAVQIESLCTTLERAMVKSRGAVRDVLAASGDVKQNTFKLLQNIASGNAPGRQDGCLCLMTAAGRPCPFADRASCIGCGNEVLTKSLMQTLINEYVRLSAQGRRSDDTEARRSRQIIEHAVLPAVMEMLSAIRMLWPDADTSELLDIMEEGVNYADSDTRGNKRELQPIHGRLGS
jgi:hypothetical protein